MSTSFIHVSNDDDDTVRIFIITGNGYWTVGPDITDIGGWIISEKTGLQTIPTSGWEYADGTGTWPADPDLKFIKN